MRCIFLGAGSIGSLFGGYLAMGGHEVTLLGRKPHVSTIQSTTLTLQTPEGNFLTSSLKAVSKIDPSPTAEWDVIFVTVKSHANEQLSDAYAWLFSTLTPVVIIQNGIGNEEPFLARWPQLPLARVLTSNGALIEKPGRVIHTGHGPTEIGLVNDGVGFSPSLQNFAQFFSDSGITTTISENIQASCWKKVFVNIGINPFGAITRLTNGKLIENPLLQQMMREAVLEAEKVARKDYPQLPPGDYVDIMFEVAKKTAKNRNSMLQDVEKQKPTEILAINGYVVMLGKKYGIPTPVNSVLTALLLGLEESLSKP